MHPDKGLWKGGSEKVTVHRVIYVNYANCKELSSTTTLRTLGAAYKIFISHNEEEGKAAAKTHRPLQIPLIDMRKTSVVYEGDE